LLSACHFLVPLFRFPRPAACSRRYSFFLLFFVLDLSCSASSDAHFPLISPREEASSFLLYCVVATLLKQAKTATFSFLIRDLFLVHPGKWTWQSMKTSRCPPLLLPPFLTIIACFSLFFFLFFLARPWAIPRPHLYYPAPPLAICSFE